jgi:hypothetical protein
MKAYKLTDENGQTRSSMQWGANVSHSATGKGVELCSDGWIHFYTNPLLAVIFNQIHANFRFPKLWECETSGEELHEPFKSGCKTLTTIREIPLPEITLNQKIAFGILCTKKIFKEEKWNEWADKWLNGEDRTVMAAASAASAAVDAAAYAAYAAVDAAAYAAAYDAYDAYAANAAAYAASAAVDAAAYDAYDAVDAAVDAAAVKPLIDFNLIAQKALTYK